MTFTRWHDVQYPAETYRLVSLASTALTQIGVASPRSHIIVVECAARPMPLNGPVGVATILVSREPFSPDDLNLLQKLTDQMRFEIVLSPRQAADATFARLASGKDLEEFVKTLPGRIEAPTDDSPFFLCNFEVRDVFHSLLGRHLPGVHRPAFEETFGRDVHRCNPADGSLRHRPVVLNGPKILGCRGRTLFLFFAAIGLGFMLVEVSQLQRLMIFLGHPTYSLSTVLFTLLLSSGLGSYSTGSSHHADSKLWPIARLLGLLVGARTFWASDAPRGRRVRVLQHAGADCCRRGHPVSSRVFHGDGISVGNESRFRSVRCPHAVALGLERSGLRDGFRGRFLDRAGIGSINGVLDGFRLLHGGPCQLSLDSSREKRRVILIPCRQRAALCVLGSAPSSRLRGKV